jgi:hypothetical protein
VKITTSGVPNLLNYGVIFIVYIKFTNVAVSCIKERGRLHAALGPQVGHP